MCSWSCACVRNYSLTLTWMGVKGGFHGCDALWCVCSLPAWHKMSEWILCEDRPSSVAQPSPSASLTRWHIVPLFLKDGKPWKIRGWFRNEAFFPQDDNLVCSLSSYHRCRSVAYHQVYRTRVFPFLGWIPWRGLPGCGLPRRLFLHEQPVPQDWYTLPERCAHRQRVNTFNTGLLYSFIPLCKRGSFIQRIVILALVNLLLALLHLTTNGKITRITKTNVTTIPIPLITAEFSIRRTIP